MPFETDKPQPAEESSDDPDRAGGSNSADVSEELVRKRIRQSTPSPRMGNAPQDNAVKTASIPGNPENAGASGNQGNIANPGTSGNPPNLGASGNPPNLGASGNPANPGTNSRPGNRIILTNKELCEFLKVCYNELGRQERRDRMRRRRIRRYWVHPMNVLRNQRGHIAQLYSELRSFPPKFYEFTRMPLEAFDRLVEILSPFLQSDDPYMRTSISPMERLLITLRFLATGESYASLHLQFRVGKSTISGIVRCTCHLIWQHLQPISMPTPTQDTWLQVAAGFQSVAKFPNCIGAVDGKQIRVQQPPPSGSIYVNYKKYFSVLLMAVADAQFKFVAIDVSAYGSTGVSRALLNSEFGRQVLQDQVTLPSPKSLPGTRQPVPFVLVGDEAFPLMNNLLCPYPRRGLDAPRKVFNTRLIRAQRFVECTLGIMSSKWRVFTTAMRLDKHTVDGVIKAACVLHNYVRDYESPDIRVETLAGFGESPFTWGPGRPSKQGAVVRNTFMSYFMSPEGAVPWQFDNL